MTHPGDTLRILSHRACLSGPDGAAENSLPALHRARALGFDVEFDVNRADDGGRLVLTHDPQAWTPAHDAAAWLTQPQAGALHALNVKNIGTLPAVISLLQSAGTQGQFFLFDFEMLTDKVSSRSLMRSLAEQGLTVAYRLSEREPFFEDYRRAQHIQTLWLDEFEEPWLTPDHVRALRDAGKKTFYVSPDLHGRRDLAALRRRWGPLIEAGVSGICTDYPLALAEFGGISLPKENAPND